MSGDADAADPDGDPEEPPDWQQYFAFDEPYENQPDAIESTIDVARRNGYLAMEGPCGTGKTMAALTAGATLVREGEYDRLLVVTPVKQQLQQFVEDLRAMNAGLDDPLNGIALVGKADLCPYEREDVFPPGASVHDRCEDLREDTARLVESDSEAAQPAAASATVEADSDEDEQWWDPQKASDLTKAARRDPDSFRTLADDTLSTAGADSPYRREQPQAPTEMVEGDDAPLFCPFEADWYARNKGSPVGFEAGEANVLTTGEFLPATVERGTCPHRAMRVLMRSADVVIGNYNHVFDPKTRGLTADVIDEGTFVIVDEAHRLEERVRDLLSDRVGRHTLVRARNDCNQLLQHANQSRDHKAEIKDRLSAQDVTLDAVEAAADFYDDLLAWLTDRVGEYLDSEFGRDWRAEDFRGLPEQDQEVPLRDPETAETDELTEWAEREGYTGDIWRTLPAVGAAVEQTLDDLGERQCVAAAVGATMANWWERDHVTYFREIELEHAPTEDGATASPWQQYYTAGLLCYDCMPAGALRDIFDGLGGGVLMSATLEPMDVFTQVSGLAELEENGEGGWTTGAGGDAGEDGEDGDGDDTGRPVESRSYGLTFPEANRASWLVDATAFTARNRGDPEQDHGNRVRDEYEQVLRTVARSPGNVMITMPNYREAAWAGAYLEGVVEKEVLVDESSSNEATDDLKADFFGGPGNVLVTSTRGTLTEGVDYDGNKLHACAVVGVPLVNIGSPRVRAVKQAYGRAFGEDNAFEYALTVPAVRRSRQAIGRVIRGTEEVGVRLLVGNRYTPDAVHSVFDYLSPAECREFVRMTPDFLSAQFDSFWADRPTPE